MVFLSILSIQCKIRCDRTTDTQQSTSRSRTGRSQWTCWPPLVQVNCLKICINRTSKCFYFEILIFFLLCYLVFVGPMLAMMAFSLRCRVPCKRRSSVNSGAWLQRFDDVTGVEKSCFVKAIKRKKSEGKMLYHCNLISVSRKHGMRGSWRYLKNLYIHNC